MSDERANALDTAEAEFEAFRQQEHRNGRLWDPWAQQPPETRAEWVQSVLFRGRDASPADGQDCQATHCPPSATQDCDWPRCAGEQP